MDGISWQTVAACRGMNPDIFLPERGDTAGVKNALAICGECPVMDACRQYANATKQRDGIWGGQTARQRRETQFVSVTRACSECGNNFRTRNDTHVSCSAKCSQQRNNRQRRSATR